MRLLPILSTLLILPVVAEDGHDLLEYYCYDCHGDGRKKGEISLEDLIAEQKEGDEFAWHKAWKITRHELMPPADEEQPTREERAQMTRWIASNMLDVDLADPDPGRVTIRRLNRMEYDYTISDLFGVDLRKEGNYSSDSMTGSHRLRDLLPPDDKAFGFDNIGDFQSLSPALLEKYFEIAEFIVENVVSLDGPDFPSRDLSREIDRDEHSDPKRVEHIVRLETETAGAYKFALRFSLGGWEEYGGAYEFELSVDGQPRGDKTIEVGGQETHFIEEELELAPGSHEIIFTTTAVKPDHRGDMQHLRLYPKAWLTGPMDPALATYPESHRRVFFRGNAPESADERRQYAREILERVASRAFRRPVAERTLDRLTELALSEDQFERGVAHALTAVLTSPKFLFRAELQPQPNDPSTVHEIDDYALASRLSYFLWLSLPDEELTALAARGELRHNLDAQLQRMLQDRKARRFFEDFPGQWLRTRNVLMTPISRRDGEINPVRRQMKEETEMLFEHIARNDRDLLEIITADYTFLDERLAKLYGIDGVEGREMRKVDLPADSKRGGILTHGSFLVSTSNPYRTSPVKRGLFVLENLLAMEPPPPPPTVPSLEDARTEDGSRPRTVKEQLELHRADKSCASCHAHFDPIGLVLENYDVVSKWRNEDAGEPIEPNEKTVTGQTLTGVEDIRSYFRDRKDLFYRCATEKLLTYALGRGLGPADALTVDAITETLVAEGGKFSTLMREVVHSPAFLTRRGDDGKVVEPPRIDIPKPPPPEKRKRRRFRADEFPNAQKAEREREREKK